MSTSLLVSPCVLLEAVFVVEPPPKRVDIVIIFGVDVGHRNWFGGGLKVLREYVNLYLEVLKGERTEAPLSCGA